MIKPDHAVLENFEENLAYVQYGQKKGVENCTKSELKEMLVCYDALLYHLELESFEVEEALNKQGIKTRDAQGDRIPSDLA